MPRPIALASGPLAGGRLPAICAPLVATTADALAAEAKAIAVLQPDLLEWRVDFFASIDDVAAVVDAARRIRAAAPGLPLLFTRRSQREGGQPIPLGEEAVLALYAAICEAGLAELVDWEMESEPAHVDRVLAMALTSGAKLVLSFHNFQATPPAGEVLARLRKAAALGADVAKVAVMPRGTADVLALLQATQAASEELEIPVITMSMGGLGAVTRLCGGAFGSALTFAVGAQASAPGQMPIADVRQGLEILQRATQGG